MDWFDQLMSEATASAQARESQKAKVKAAAKAAREGRTPHVGPPPVLRVLKSIVYVQRRWECARCGACGLYPAGMFAEMVYPNGSGGRVLRLPSQCDLASPVPRKCEVHAAPLVNGCHECWSNQINDLLGVEAEEWKRATAARLQEKLDHDLDLLDRLTKREKV